MNPCLCLPEATACVMATQCAQCRVCVQADTRDLFDRLDSRAPRVPASTFSFGFCGPEEAGSVQDDAALIAATDRFLQQAPVSTSSGSTGAGSSLPDPIAEMPGVCLNAPPTLRGRNG